MARTLHQILFLIWLYLFLPFLFLVPLLIVFLSSPWFLFHLYQCCTSGGLKTTSDLQWINLEPMYSHLATTPPLLLLLWQPESLRQGSAANGGPGSPLPMQGEGGTDLCGTA